MVQNLDEGILREVFGRFPVTDHAEDERKHRPFVAAHQLAERELTALLRQPTDIGIGERPQLVESLHRMP